MSIKQHFDHLLTVVPDLMDRHILDLGSGRGKFLIDATKRGANITGLELNPEYIALTHQVARQAGTEVQVVQGKGEALPFDSAQFDFANLSEVIEHVQDPSAVLSELHRVLAADGKAYVSVPSRFSIRDTHFHLYFVNWLPRALADWYIGLLGRHKNYTTDAGHQQLKDMHYFTFGAIRALAESKGFEVMDIRQYKLQKRSAIERLLYRLLRPWYFDTFHLLLKKK